MKKHIYIYSPSSAVRDKASFKRGLARLKALGHEVEVDEAALSSQQRFAGDDEARIAAIARAAASGADVALKTIHLEHDPIPASADHEALTVMES